MQPVPEHAASHVGRAGIEQGEQSVGGISQYGFGDFQVAAGRCIHAHEGVVPLHLQCLDVGDIHALRQADVIQQGAGRPQGNAQVFAAKTGQVMGFKLPREIANRGILIEVPGRQPLEAQFLARRRGFELRQRERLRQENFRRFQALELACEIADAGLQDAKLACRQIEPCHPQGRFAHAYGKQRAVALFFQQRCISQCSRGNDARDLTLHGTLGGRRITGLLADDHRFTKPHQFRQILLGRMVGHACHLDGLAR